MKQKILSICIPTYNRENDLKTSLNNIISQIEKLKFMNKIEICISNNGSKDNTKDVINNFKKKHPNLIKYNENKINLGFENNLLKIIDMASGEFIWTLSDDDFVVKDGIKTIIKLITENKNENIGGIALKDNSYVFDEMTGKKIKYHSSVDKNKPNIYRLIGLNEVIQDVPYRLISALIFNRKLLKKILKEKQNLVKMGFYTCYLHSWLYFLLFLFNKDYKCYVINRSILISPNAKPRYKFVLEDSLKLIYKGKIEFFKDLISIVDKSDKNIVNAIKKARGHPNINIINCITLYRAFGLVKYNSSIIYKIKTLFKNISFIEALLISIYFIIILMIHPIILKKICKYGLIVKYGKKAKSIWLEVCIVFNYWNDKNSSRRATF